MQWKDWRRLDFCEAKITSVKPPIYGKAWVSYGYQDNLSPSTAEQKSTQGESIIQVFINDRFTSCNSPIVESSLGILCDLFIKKRKKMSHSMKQELFSFFKLVQFSFYIFRTRTNRRHSAGHHGPLCVLTITVVTSTLGFWSCFPSSWVETLWSI